MTIEKEQIISNTVSIQTKSIFRSKNIDSYLKYYLKKKYEGKCYQNGYIIPDSLEMIQRSVGRIKTIDRQNYTNFEVTYKIKSIIPSNEDIFMCIINSVTKMGIVAYLDYKEKKESDIQESPLLFIIPKEYFEEEQMEKMEIGDKIKVKVLDTRIKFMAKQIQIIGEPIFE